MDLLIGFLGLYAVALIPGFFIAWLAALSAAVRLK